MSRKKTPSFTSAAFYTIQQEADMLSLRLSAWNVDENAERYTRSKPPYDGLEDDVVDMNKGARRGTGYYAHLFRGQTLLPLDDRDRLYENGGVLAPFKD